MNEMEIYFARENALWNLSIIIYFILLIPVFYVIGSMIIFNIKNKWRKRKENKENGRWNSGQVRRNL